MKLSEVPVEDITLGTPVKDSTGLDGVITDLLSIDGEYHVEVRWSMGVFSTLPQDKWHLLTIQ
jgi:hypothetical protein